MLSKYNLLVVEDDMDGAEVIEWMLHTKRAKTTVVMTGEEALDQLANEPTAFSAVLIDLALPQMDGFQVLAQVREHSGKHLPAIAMTAFHTPELRERALEAGFDAYVPKPIDQKLLINTIQQLLN